MNKFKFTVCLCAIITLLLSGCNNTSSKDYSSTTVTEKSTSSVVITDSIDDSQGISSETSGGDEFITDDVDIDKIKSIATSTYTDSVGNSYYVVDVNDKGDLAMFSIISDSSDKEKVVRRISLGIASTVADYAIKTQFNIIMILQFVDQNGKIIAQYAYGADNGIVFGKIRWCNEEYQQLYNDSGLKESIDSMSNPKEENSQQD